MRPPTPSLVLAPSTSLSPDSAILLAQAIVSGVMVAALYDLAPLYCSDVDLACSDLIDCADNGATAAPTYAGILVAA